MSQAYKGIEKTLKKLILLTKKENKMGNGKSHTVGRLILLGSTRLRGYILFLYKCY